MEQSPQHELLSSGLRIERSFEIATERRRYRLLPRTLPTTASPVAADTPRGIVFHTTESELAPFNEAAGKRIAVIGKGLLAYVQRHRAYHYVVDRFGRVFRVVAESDSAWHAGHAIWADDHWSYLDLNNEFLAIAVETNTDPTAETPPASEAQIRSLRLLTAFLRQKYGIHSQNCVTHAQVSVNPANRQIGWHTDWAANFPFEAIDLPNNYETPLPSVLLFGFHYDGQLVQSTGAPYWRGVLLAEEQVRAAADRAGSTLSRYRDQQAKCYREAVRTTNSRKEDKPV